MNAARLTAASVHHLLDLDVDPGRPAGAAGSADTVLTVIASFRCMYVVPVYRSYTSYRYVVHPYLYGV
jgi:hypothetical protein